MFVYFQISPSKQINSTQLNSTQAPRNSRSCLSTPLALEAPQELSLTPTQFYPYFFPNVDYDGFLTPATDCISLYLVLSFLARRYRSTVLQLETEKLTDP